MLRQPAVVATLDGKPIVPAGSRLRARVFVIIVLACVALLALTCYREYGQWRYRLQAAIAESGSRALTLAARQARSLTEMAQLFGRMAESLEHPAVDLRSACTAQLDAARRQLSHVDAVHFVRLDGTPLCGAPMAAGEFSPAAAVAALKRGSLVIEGPVRRPSGEFVVPVYKSVLLAREPAVFVAPIRLASFYPREGEGGFPPGARVGIVAPDGIVVARYPDPEGWIGRSAATTSVYRAIEARHGEGAFEDVGLDGVPRIVGLTRFMQTEAGPLHLWVATPRAALAHDLTIEFVVAMGVGLLIIASTLLGAGAWLDRSVLRPVQALSRAASRISAGDLAARVEAPPGDHELSRLGATFNAMAEGLHVEKRQVVLMQRALRVLSSWGRALGDDAFDDELQEVMCRAIVEDGGYVSAAVEYLPGGRPDLSLRPVGAVRRTTGRVELLLGAPSVPVTDVARTAIETGRAVVRPEAGASGASAEGPPMHKRGAFPVEVDGRVVAALTVEASEPEAFGRAETALLAELASNLSSALTLRHARRQRETLHRSLDGVKSELQQSRRKYEDDIRRTLADAIEAVAATVEARDSYTAGHQRRVADLAVAIAEAMQMPPDLVEGIRLAAMVHDLGKIQIPVELLSKAGRLTAQEWQLVRSHPQVGYGILKGLDFPWPVAITVLQHHERMDGSGYPSRLEGEQILPEARIVAVADVVEAMTTERPYRHALGVDEAVRAIERERGKGLDADVVDACLRVIDAARTNPGDLGWLMGGPGRRAAAGVTA